MLPFSTSPGQPPDIAVMAATFWLIDWFKEVGLPKRLIFPTTIAVAITLSIGMGVLPDEDRPIEQSIRLGIETGMILTGAYSGIRSALLPKRRGNHR